MTDEQVVLLSDDGREIGEMSKVDVHGPDTPLHKAFSCYIFDERGLLLVTQRAKTKGVWPGVWTNSVCGHPAPGESDESAIRRRAMFELGMEVCDIQVVLPDYRYRTPPYKGIIENEICPVYVARASSVVDSNPLEVEDYKWMSWSQYAADLLANPESYSYWAKDQYLGLTNSSSIEEYATLIA